MSQTKARKKPGVVRFFEGIAEFFTSTIKAFVEGDIFVKLSALLCGTSCFARKQYLKGFFICLIQAAIMLVFPTFFFPYMSKLSTLGTVQQKRVFNPETMKNEFNDYDNSFLILLFGVLGVVLLITAVILWMRNLRNAREVELTAKSGQARQHLPRRPERRAGQEVPPHAADAAGAGRGAVHHHPADCHDSHRLHEL